MWQPSRSDTKPAERPTIPVSTSSTQAPQTAAPTAAATLDPATKLRVLYQKAVERCAGINTYVARLKRKEQVGGTDRPEEVMVFKFRKQPFSVYLKFLGPVAAGREVIYVQGQHEGKIHTLAAAGDSIFVAAGQRIALSSDSMLVRSKSRHPITDAGIGNLVERFGRVLNAGGQLGTLRYIGPLKRSEYATPLEEVVQEIPTRSESALPRGGRRYWLFEPGLVLPVLVITQDHTGHMVEYYCYDQIQLGVPLDDDDFNPDKLWGRR
jgi:hypothetical protein